MATRGLFGFRKDGYNKPLPPVVPPVVNFGMSLPYYGDIETKVAQNLVHSCDFLIMVVG